MRTTVRNKALAGELRRLRARVAELESGASAALPAGGETVGGPITFSDVIDCLPDATFVLDRDRRIVAWNRAAEEMTGARKEEIVGRGGQAYALAFYGEHRPTLVDLLDRDDPALHALYDSVQRKDSLYAETFNPTLYGGRGAYVSITATPLLDSDGKFVGAIETVRDITDRKQAQAQQRRLARAIDAAVEAVVLTDKDGRIEQVNPAFTRITGYSAGEAIGETPRVLKSGHHPPEFYEQMWATITAKQVYSDRVINKRKDGSFYHAALTIAPIYEEGGAVTGYVGVQRDVTADIEREKALADALEQARAATRAKSQFLAKMSHELRTPLNSIIGFSELMIDDPNDPPGEKRARRLEKVHRNAKNLLALINDILDISKVEAGRLTLDCRSVNVVALVTECVESAQPLFSPERISLEMQVDGQLRADPHWRGDDVRLRQVLTNLLGNAAKFTEAGRIVLRAGIEQGQLRIDVEDTGIGIAAEDLPTIFDEFQQVDSSSTRRAGGTGLGLAICRRLCGLMGGEISAVSTPGVGSCFTIRLPRCRNAGRGNAAVGNDEAPPDAR